MNLPLSTSADMVVNVSSILLLAIQHLYPICNAEETDEMIMCKKKKERKKKKNLAVSFFILQHIEDSKPYGKACTQESPGILEKTGTPHRT